MLTRGNYWATSGTATKRRGPPPDGCGRLLSRSRNRQDNPEHETGMQIALGKDRPIVASPVADALPLARSGSMDGDPGCAPLA